MAQRDLILKVNYQGETYQLDIDTNIPLRIDISSLENDKIGRLYGIGSQEFDLPGTKRNNEFFKNAFEIGAVDTPGLYGFIDSFLLLNGDIILDGKMQLIETIASDDGYVGYKVQIIDQSVDFKSQIEGAFISQAPGWSEYDHVIDIAAITSSWQDDLVNGNVFYPLCDFGTDGEIEFPTRPRIMTSNQTASFARGSIDNFLTPMGFDQFQPAVKATAVFDTIFDQAGYGYTSSLVTGSNDVFSNLFVLPKSNEQNGPVVSGSTVNTMTAGFTSSLSIPAIPNTSYVIYNAPFYDEVSDPGSNYFTSGVNAPYYTASAYGEYTVNAFVESTDMAPASGFGVTATLELQVFNNSGTLVNIITMGSRYFAPGFPGTNATFGGSRTFTMNLGDYFIPKVDFYNSNTSLSSQAFTLVSGSNSYLDMTVAPFVFGGTTVEMGAQFDSDTKTVDVLRGFIEQFNLVIVPEPDEARVLRVETFDTWMLMGREIDWTSKYDKAKRVGIKHPISEQNKTIQIGGAEDNDRFSKIAKESEPNLQYGTRQVVSTSTIPLGTRKITSYFAPIIVGSMIQSGSVDFDGNSTFNLSGNTMFVPHLYKLGNAAQELFAFKPRLGYKLNHISASNPLNEIWIGENGVANSVNEYSTLANINTLDTTKDIYNLHFDETYPDYTAVGGAYQTAEAASENAYNLFWDNYVQGLYWDEARKVTLDLFFEPNDYKDIRLNDIILIKDQRYRINKIKGFNVMYPDVVTCELIKEYPVYNNLSNLTVSTGTDVGNHFVSGSGRNASSGLACADTTYDVIFHYSGSFGVGALLSGSGFDSPLFDQRWYHIKSGSAADVATISNESSFGYIDYTFRLDAENYVMEINSSSCTV